MLRHKLEPELGSLAVKDQSSEMNFLAQNPTEFQNRPSGATEQGRTTELQEPELEEYRSKMRQQELTLQAERHAWQCELAEKQLLLQSRSAEIEQNRSEIALLRKRVRELELVCQQSFAASASNAPPQPERKVAAFDATRNAKIHEERSTLETAPKESIIARRSPLEKGSQENWDPRDDDFVMGEPRLPDVREINFTRPEGEGNAKSDETEEKSSKIFGSRRWRIRGQKRRWKSRSEKQADNK